MNLKSNPRSQAASTFVNLFGEDFEFEVFVSREDPDLFGSKGGYRTNLVIDGTIVATALHRDRRESYEILKSEIENLYRDGLALV
jgi:hypothetical protein